MISLASFLTPPGPCGYLPDRTWQLHYDVVAAASPEDFERRLNTGWRRFGRAFFRPRCPQCRECRSLRVLVAQYGPDRSQRRNHRRNQGEVRLEIGEPSVTEEKLDLYDRFHAFQARNVGWPEHAPKDDGDYAESFVDNPFPTEEWRYYVGADLVGVGYVDVLANGLSAIYYFHEPTLRERGLGTWNVQCVIAEAGRRKKEFAYLGYFVAGCRSSEYKFRFRPAQWFDLTTGIWSEAGGNVACRTGPS